MMNRGVIVLWLAAWGPLVMMNCEAFTLMKPTTSMASTRHVSCPPSGEWSHGHHMVPPATEFTVSLSSSSFSSLILADESWRQYVSLLLIGGVLIDILLGSPLANMALKPLRGDDQEQEESNNKKNKNKNQETINRSRERIDSDAVAKAAIERAQNALELRRFLDEQKTDWDRMEEMKRKLDAEMQELDADLKAREESLKRKSKGSS